MAEVKFHPKGTTFPDRPDAIVIVVKSRGKLVQSENKNGQRIWSVAREHADGLIEIESNNPSGRPVYVIGYDEANDREARIQNLLVRR